MHTHLLSPWLFIFENPKFTYTVSSTRPITILYVTKQKMVRIYSHQSSNSMPIILPLIIDPNASGSIWSKISTTNVGLAFSHVARTKNLLKPTFSKAVISHGLKFGLIAHVSIPKMIIDGNLNLTPFPFLLAANFKQNTHSWEVSKLKWYIFLFLTIDVILLIMLDFPFI